MSDSLLIHAPTILDIMSPADSETTSDLASAPTDDTVRWEQRRAWMIAAQRGDRTAYRNLLLDLTPYLRRIAARYVPWDDIEDAVQETLLVVHDIRHTYEPSRPFKPWLSTIAARRSIDMLRRRSQRAKFEMEQEGDFEFAQDQALTPDEHVSRVESADRLRQAIDELPPRQREAVRLLQIAELSSADAAAQSALSPGALKVACHRAMKSLKSALSRKGDLDE